MTKDSRLEKFLKALCSLDYSDLPTPLSRVEVLWNCLITGEATPDFQPQSRTEKYLMTILGVYDLEDIPQPISGAEMLLHKLATGDTDVELEDGAKSIYERLLSEIVANGGAGGVDFEYITYVLSESFNTLYNTVDKSVKSAILKGQTLVNLSTLSGEFTVKPNSVQFISPQNIKQNTIYTIMFNCSTVPTTGFVEFRQANDNTALKMENIPVVRGDNKFKTETVNTQLNKFRFKNDSTSETDFIFNNLVILEGDYTNEDIPFFEGMQSVKMPVLTTIGKNLCSVSNNVFMPTSTSTWYFANGVKESLFGSKLKRNSDCEWFYLPYGVYTFSFGDGTSSGFQLIAEGEKYNYGITNNATRTISEGWYTVRIKSTSSNLEQIRVVNLQIERGSKPTSYEPYKSNILTTAEEVELRGIDDIKDELDLLTGELTRHIREVVLNGSENWILSSSKELTQIFYIKIDDAMYGGKVLCDVLKKSDGTDSEVINLTSFLYVGILKTKASTVAKLKEYLSSNPITVQYQLAKGAVKTVDLPTVLDQDGNKTKLKTFNDITHVSLSSEGLSPEAEMTVATKNLDDISQLSTMSLRMNDISERQNELENEVDTQSEGIDSTMMATTEIYEQTL